MSDEEDDSCEEFGSSLMAAEDWIKKQSDYLKKIKKFKLKKGDRLHSIAEVSYMHKILCETMLSWSNWVNGWVSIELGKKIDVEEGLEVTVSDDELSELHKKYQDIATTFLEMDLKLTDSFTKRMKEKVSKECAIKPENKAMVA